jgi:hypothetical protein
MRLFTVCVYGTVQAGQDTDYCAGTDTRGTAVEYTPDELSRIADLEVGPIQPHLLGARVIVHHLLV